MTRVLLVTHTAILPPRTGGQQAVAGLAFELAVWWPVTLSWIERKTTATEHHESAGRAIDVDIAPKRWLQRHAARWLHGSLGVVDTDIGTMLFASGHRKFVTHLADICKDGDIVVLAHPWLWPSVRRLRSSRRLTLVYDAHNVEWQLKLASFRPSVLSAWVLSRVRAMEAQLVQHADLTLACTEGDADALARMAGVTRGRFLVGSKGVAASARADDIARRRALREPARVALFVGSNHPPNNSAARWIIETLAPSCLDWRFDIAGACGPATNIDRVPDNVRVLGPVDDLLHVMEESDLALNPVTSGSGINMKLFDYLMCGLPVLTTPLGARGFEGIGRTGLVIRDLTEFRTSLDWSTSDLAAYRQLSKAGVDCVRDHFAWSVVGRRVRSRILAVHEELAAR